MCSSSRVMCDRLDLLQTRLDRLKHELAQAWVSPENAARVPQIEDRIRRVWDQMDRLAVSLSEPVTRAGA